MEDLATALSWIACLKSEVESSSLFDKFKWFIKRDVTRTLGSLIHSEDSN
jgi:hypothetical protein